MMCTADGAAPLRKVGHEIGNNPFARLDRRLVGGIGAGRSLRRPAEERHRAFDRQVEPDLSCAQRRILNVQQRSTWITHYPQPI